MWGSVLGCCSRRSNHFFVPRAVRRAVASAPQTSPANARCKHTKQQPARGMRDLLPDDAQRLRHVVDTVHRVARAFGFRETITPVVEHATLFQRTLGLDSDVVSKEMYTLGPDNDLCLRPENTAGKQKNTFFRQQRSNIRTQGGVALAVTFGPAVSSIVEATIALAIS
eukprot:m.190811 g.190811  ORF g.190811 m.190811 type:complete len:168 (+) comp18239_c0_seq6:135-638(+)